MIDTGSSYITGPASSVSVLMKTIGAQLDESGVSYYTPTLFPTKKQKSKFITCHHLFISWLHQYRVNCDTVKTLPSVTFHLGGQEYLLTHEDYILWVSTMTDNDSLLICYYLNTQDENKTQMNLFFFGFSSQSFKEMSALSPSWAWMCRPPQAHSGSWEPTSLPATTQNLTVTITG